MLQLRARFSPGQRCRGRKWLSFSEIQNLNTYKNTVHFGMVTRDAEVRNLTSNSLARTGRPALPGHWPPSPSWQWVLGLCTVAILICYADRTNISVAIVAMARDYGWDEAYKGTILSAFFLGYATTQLIGGTLADRYGGQSVLAFGVVLWSFFTFITPEAAAGGTATLIACRIAMGLGEVRFHPFSVISCSSSRTYSLECMLNRC
jgi:hypothetical protein